MSPRRMSVESSTAQGKAFHRHNKSNPAFSGGLGPRNKLRPSERYERSWICDIVIYIINSFEKILRFKSMESGLAMGTNRVLAAQDLTKVLLTDDYFSDVNPRSMRRLMNVIYVTGRLLKAFQIDFNWLVKIMVPLILLNDILNKLIKTLFAWRYHLASWVNITGNINFDIIIFVLLNTALNKFVLEQWPYRTSWIILFCEVNEDKIDDFTTLKSVYERVKMFIPTSKDTEPHLEIDRDEKKFETFLSFHRNTLQVLFSQHFNIKSMLLLNFD